MLNPVSEKNMWKTDVSFLFRLGSQKKLQIGGHRSPQVEVVAGHVSSDRLNGLGKSHRMSEDRLIPIQCGAPKIAFSWCL